MLHILPTPNAPSQSYTKYSGFQNRESKTFSRLQNRNAISKKWLPSSMIPCSQKLLDILPPTGKEMVSMCSIAFDVSFLVKIHIIESMWSELGKNVRFSNSGLGATGLQNPSQFGLLWHTILEQPSRKMWQVQRNLWRSMIRIQVFSLHVDVEPQSGCRAPSKT